MTSDSVCLQVRGESLHLDLLSDAEAALFNLLCIPFNEFVIKEEEKKKK